MSPVATKVLADLRELWLISSSGLLGVTSCLMHAAPIGGKQRVSEHRKEIKLSKIIKLAVIVILSAVALLSAIALLVLVVVLQAPVQDYRYGSSDYCYWGCNSYLPQRYTHR
jgi:hypothetical protein